MMDLLDNQHGYHVHKVPNIVRSVSLKAVGSLEECLTKSQLIKHHHMTWTELWYCASRFEILARSWLWAGILRSVHDREKRSLHRYIFCRCFNESCRSLALIRFWISSGSNSKLADFGYLSIDIIIEFPGTWFIRFDHPFFAAFSPVKFPARYSSQASRFKITDVSFQLNSY